MHQMITRMLGPVYSLLETSGGYRLNQRIGAPTVAVYRSFLRDHVSPHLDRNDAILDIGCGIGGFFNELGRARYVGIDINPDYIAVAKAELSGDFRVMDATALQLGRATFDHATTIAIAHHLDDGQLIRMLREGLRVLRPGGALHVVDPILPMNVANIAKQAMFRLDRGRHQRKLAQLLDCISTVAAIETSEVRSSPLHDVVYVRLRASNA